MTEVQCGKVTFQFQCSSDSTNGTGVQGGQIPRTHIYAEKASRSDSLEPNVVVP